MRNKSLIHTKDIKTQEGTPLHLEYYLLNDSVLGGCAECYGVAVSYTHLTLPTKA